MAENTGKPSGVNKEEGTGLRPEMPAEKVQKDLDATEKYTSGEDEIAENIRELNPNRNVDKGDATNAGGYRN